MTGSKSTRLSTGTSSTFTKKTQPSTTSSMSAASTSSQTPSTSSQTPSPSSQTSSTSSQTPSTSSQTQSTPPSRKQELEEQRKTIKEEEEREFQLLGELGDEDGDDYEEEKETKDEPSSATSGIKYYRGRLPEHQFKKIQENKVDLVKEIQWRENLITELVSYEILNDEQKQLLGSIQTERIKSLITILLHCGCPKTYYNFLKCLIKLEFHRPVRMLEPNHEIWKCCIKYPYRADEYDFNHPPDFHKNKEFISRNEDNMNKFCEKAEAIPFIASVRPGSIEVTYLILVPKENKANEEDIKAQMENSVNHGQIGDIPVMKEGFTFEKIEETEEDIEKDIQRMQAKVERLKRKRERLEKKKKKKKEETEDRDETTMDAIPVTPVLSEQPGPVTEIPTEQPIPKPSTSVEMDVEPSSSTAKRLKREGGILSTFFPSKSSGKNKKGAESTPEIVEIPDTREKSYLKMDERLLKKPHEEMEMDDQQTTPSTSTTSTRKQELEAKRKTIKEEEEREFQLLRELGDEDDDDVDDDDEHAMEIEEEKTQIDSSTKSTPAPTAAQNRGKIPEEDYQKLQKNFSFLRDDIWPTDLIHVLFSKSVFDEDTTEQCTLTLDNKGRANCAEFLLKALFRARKDALEMFIKILEETSHINSVRLLNPGSPLWKDYNPDEWKFYRGRLPEHEFKKIQKNKFDLVEVVRPCKRVITALVSYMILNDEDEDRLKKSTLTEYERTESLFTTLLHCGPRAYRYLLKALLKTEFVTALRMLDPNHEIYKCQVKQPDNDGEYDLNNNHDSPKNKEFILKNEVNMDNELCKLYGKDQVISGVSNVKKGCIEVTFLILNLDKNKTNSEDIKKHLENSVNQGKLGDIPVMKEGFTFEKIEETEEDIEKDIQRRQAKIARLKRKRERLEKKKKKEETEDRASSTK